jgi:hypothetical protein
VQLSLDQCDVRHGVALAHVVVYVPVVPVMAAVLTEARLVIGARAEFLKCLVASKVLI